MLGREYGKGWERRFSRFDWEPVAAASIGQVHRAATPDGRDLALKIQYPGVARSIAGDVDNVAVLLRLFNLLPLELDVAGLAAEAKSQLLQEADYESEGRFLERYARLVADEPALVVPRVHWDLTTPRVMAMDFMEGEPLEALAAAPQSRRDAVGALLERLMFRELFEFRVMQTDPNFANYLYQPASGRVVLLDFGATKRFGAAFVANFARITRAVIDGDRDAVAREAIRIGYAAADDSPERMRGGGRRRLPRLRAAAAPRALRLPGVGPAFARARPRLRPRVPARAAAVAAARDDLPAPQARGLVPAAGPHRGARRRARAGAASLAGAVRRARDRPLCDPIVLQAISNGNGVHVSGLPKCPQCGSEFTYEDGTRYVCPECAHEWEKAAAAEAAPAGRVIRDANGNELHDGDTVTVIKDLKVKGSSLVVKVGVKVKNIRLVEATTTSTAGSTASAP